MNIAQDHKEELSALRTNIQLAGEKYMESLRQSKIFMPGFTEEQSGRSLDAMHRVYAETMVMVGMRPLRQGVNAESIVRVLSTMTAMYMLSPSFKQIVGERLDTVSDVIQRRIDEKTVSKMTWAEDKARRKNKNTNDYVSQKWQQRFHDIQYRNRGNREMYTARSAGLTEVALAEKAFIALRSASEVDQATIMDSYVKMVDRLYSHAEEDGIGRDEVAEASRVVLGERLLEDPRLVVMIKEISHGQARMAQPYEVRITGTEQIYKVWRGNFEDNDGSIIDLTRYQDKNNDKGIRGAFSLRPIMNTAEHGDRIFETMINSMSRHAATGDMDAFNQDLAGYLLGGVDSDSGKEPNNSDLSSDLLDRITQSRAMQASMTVDGIDIDTQRVLYSSAYADVVSAIDTMYPDFTQRWAQEYGDSWQQFVAHVNNGSSQAYDRWAARSRPENFKNTAFTVHQNQGSSGDHEYY